MFDVSNHDFSHSNSDITEVINVDIVISKAFAELFCMLPLIEAIEILANHTTLLKRQEYRQNVNKLQALLACNHEKGRYASR